MVSLTDGRAGHYRRPPEALAEIRREEAAVAPSQVRSSETT